MYNYSDYTGAYNNHMMSAGGTNYNQTLVNSYDGFIRGNMFSELYHPYISNEPFNLTPTNEREALLDKVREYGFAMTDLDLYLDTHPDDTEKIKAYNQFSVMEEQAKKEFETRYGPLTLDSETLNSYPWAWIACPWPWEVM
jgi:spore coat protein JB